MVLLFGMSFLVERSVLAQDEPVAIRLLADKTSYLPEEPIRMQVDVLNTSGEPVLTRAGFSSRDRRLLITFTDPDGNVIRSKYLRDSDEPGPPYRFEERDAAFAEYFEGSTVVLEDTREFYDLLKYGRYTAQVFEALETFSESSLDDAGNLIAFLDDASGYSPVSNKVLFELVSLTPAEQSSIQVKVCLLQIGGGTNPGAVKKPLLDVPVHLIKVSDVPDDYHPINHKTYAIIYQFVDAFRSAFTTLPYHDAKEGVANFENVPQDDYVVIALYDRSPDFRHMGSPIGLDHLDWLTDDPIEKHLMVMEKVDGKKVPCKTTKFKGSELLITEPEYIEWDSTEETYPFVFETIGDWEVTTSVAPPEGFETDYKSLDAEVINELETVQFTITDVGSSWKETKVKHKIKHKGKNQTLESKIGIKLSKKLAKEKGLGIYGETESPGPFKGGKKIKKDKDKKDKDK
jgi:hypothetical protein